MLHVIKIERVFYPTARCLQIERTLFEDTVKTLNNFYAEAEKIGGQSYLEGCLACTTAYLIFLCMETRYEKVRLRVLFTFWEGDGPESTWQHSVFFSSVRY